MMFGNRNVNRVHAFEVLRFGQQKSVFKDSGIIFECLQFLNDVAVNLNYSIFIFLERFG